MSKYIENHAAAMERIRMGNDLTVRNVCGRTVEAMCLRKGPMWHVSHVDLPNMVITANPIGQ